MEFAINFNIKKIFEGLFKLHNNVFMLIYGTGHEIVFFFFKLDYIDFIFKLHCAMVFSVHLYGHRS